MSTLSYRIDTPTIRAIARDAYIYGFPMVDNYRVQYSYFMDRGHPEYKGPWNQIFHNARVCSPGDRAVQTPNSDTPYSQLGANLRGDPLVLGMPAITDGRYYSVQFIDMYTYNFAYAGTRTTGNDAARFLLAGPHWHGEVPAGIDAVIRCETEFAFVLYRTQLRDGNDLAAVQAVQAGYRVQTLGSYLRRKQTPVRKVQYAKPLDVDEERTELQFYAILNFLLQFCPTHPNEVGLLHRFNRVGIGARHHFHTRALSAEVRRAMEDGMADAWRAYRKRAKQIALGGAGSSVLFGSRADLGDDYLARMVGAVDGIYGNSREEAIYCAYAQDASGARLDGARHRYRLRFAPGNLPPVKAFWSLTMYELPARLLVANPIDRYQISSALLPQLTRDVDGGITLHIQRDRPYPAQQPNWLPAAHGPFFMALRLYWPEAAALDGRWQPPALERVSVT